MTKYPYSPREERLSPSLGVIITYISENKKITALEMSKIIDISYNQIRNSLNILLRRGFVCKTSRGKYVIRDNKQIIEETFEGI